MARQNFNLLIAIYLDENYLTLDKIIVQYINCKLF